VDILTRIVEVKQRRLEEAKKRRSLAELERLCSEARAAYPRPGFGSAFNASDNVNVVAEVKRASPSKGIICADFRPVEVAQEYEQNGAVAISVLTEEDHFHGSLEYFSQIRNAVSLPLLRKDFIFDSYQVYESAAAGADALLLITAILDSRSLRDLLALSQEVGIDALVEVHTEDELRRASDCGARIIGVNNRNLKTFEVSLDVSLKLAAGGAPDEVILISESGINSRSDIELLRQAGYRGFLIGEQLMRAGSPGRALKELLS